MLHHLFSSRDPIRLIHNYCDRWCDKCPFTDRCEVYFEQKEIEDYMRTAQPDAEEMKKMSAQLSSAMERLRDVLEQLKALSDEMETKDTEPPKAPEPPKTLPEFSTDHHPISEEAQKMLAESAFDTARNYALDVNQFFEDNSDFFAAQEIALASKIEAGTSIDFDQLQFLGESAATIRQFQHFIFMKTRRALTDLDELSDPDLCDPIQNDQNGSAKICMIVIQRSNDAWNFFTQVFPEKRREVNHLKNHLQFVAKVINKLLPNWEKFHRPVFDDEPERVVNADFNPN
jgi:hypothetical protein